jgi:hypothetical protein
MKSVVFVLSLAATGCSIFDYDPDLGPALADPLPDANDGDGGTTANTVGCSNKDTDPNKFVSLSQDLRPLQLRAPGATGSTGGCVPCHIGRITSGFDQSSYQGLRRGGNISGTRVIIPGDPCNSILFQKIGRTPPFGSRMPYNGPAFLSQAERNLWHDWIAEGALNN